MMVSGATNEAIRLAADRVKEIASAIGRLVPMSSRGGLAGLVALHALILRGVPIEDALAEVKAAGLVVS